MAGGRGRCEPVLGFGATAIGYGRYQVVITKSERFSKAAGKTVMLLLLEVPLFQGVRIHTGNYATDSEGCLLVGTDKTKDKVTESKKAYKKVFDMLTGFLDAGDEGAHKVNGSEPVNLP